MEEGGGGAGKEEHIRGGWDVIIKKNVRTEDGLSAGVVVGVSEDNLIIEDAPNRKFVVPKEDVEGFDVSEIYVNLLKEELVSRTPKGGIMRLGQA